MEITCGHFTEWNSKFAAMTIDERRGGRYGSRRFYREEKSDGKSVTVGIFYIRYDADYADDIMAGNYPNGFICDVAEICRIDSDNHEFQVTGVGNEVYTHIYNYGVTTEYVDFEVTVRLDDFYIVHVYDPHSESYVIDIWDDLSDAVEVADKQNTDFLYDARVESHDIPEEDRCPYCVDDCEREEWDYACQCDMPMAEILDGISYWVYGEHEPAY